MVSIFQEWNFNVEDKPRSGQPKKFKDKELEALLEEDQRSNARRACRIIGSNSTSCFCTIESHGNDSKTRKLSALSTETERRWKAIFHLRTANSKTTEKRFFASDYDWRWEGDILRQPQEEKILSPVNRCIDLNTTAMEHSWFEDHALYLVGTKRILFTMSCWNLTILLWAIGIGYNWFVWAVHCEKNGRNTSKDMIKLFLFRTLGLMYIAKKNI